MKVTGIIAEYNPFHNGHKYHIEESRKKTNCDSIIAVMSGNYVQRGEPAIIDKWSRTKMALLNGVDLVIELPSIFSCATAETFAHSSVKLLNDTGIVDFISFGSESGDISSIENASSLLAVESEVFKKTIKTYLSQGMSFPVARQKTMEMLTGENYDFISYSNNILAIEYIKALSSLKSGIQPIAITRKGEGYNSKNIDTSFSSASGIRDAIAYDNFHAISKTMPENALEILMDSINKGMSPITLDAFSEYLNYLLREKSSKELACISDVAEGLENRIKSSANNYFKTTEILNFIKTKRYTYTRLQRVLLHILLNIKTETADYYKQNGYSPYIRVLGFKKDKEKLLSSIVENSSLPVLVNFKDSEGLNDNCKNLLNMENKATDIYYLGSPAQSYRKLNKEYTTPVVII